MKKKYKVILGVITLVIVIGLIMSIVDYNKVTQNESPIFCIKLADGSTEKVTYIGLGYKVIRYTGVSINEPFKNNIGVKFGNWFMNYELEEVDDKK